MQTFGLELDLFNTYSPKVCKNRLIQNHDLQKFHLFEHYGIRGFLHSASLRSK